MVSTAAIVRVKAFEMVSLTSRRRTSLILGAALFLMFLLPFVTFLRTLSEIWLRVPEFSYGAAMPLVVAYLLWKRVNSILAENEDGWLPGLALVVVGCCLQVIASFSGTLLFSAIAFATSLTGVVGFVWGRKRLRIVSGPVALLILMVPLPSYLVDELTWRLQIAASTISSAALELLGVPVYHDGNLLKLTNYVLEVKEACSGSRSIFALAALALVLGFSMERKWWVRLSLGAVALLLAVGSNVLRIVGTGLVAHQWGSIAANDSLHTAWGILTFITAVLGLIGCQRVLQWSQRTHA